MAIPLQIGESTTIADLQRLVDAKVPESETLDYKSKDYSKSKTWPASHEFCKDVVALANHRGGVLILGILDEKTIPTELAPLQGSAEDTAQRLRQWLWHWAVPMIDTDIETVETASTSEFFIVVNVPASLDQPHAVLLPGDRRPHIFPVRDGTDTRYLSQHEIATRYSQRFQGEQQRRQEFARVVSDGLERLGRTPSMWLWVAARPDSAVVSQLLTAKRFAEVREWWTYSTIESPFGTEISADVPIAAPGCVTFTKLALSDRVDGSDPRSSYVELHLDGAAFIGIDLRFNQNKVEPGKVGIFVVVECAVLAVEAASRWLHHTARQIGNAAVSIGMVDTTANRAPAELIAELLPGSGRIRRTRSLNSDSAGLICKDQTVADIPACASIQNRLALTYNCLSQLLQRFGLPEADYFTPEGAVVLEKWKEQDAVRGWAERAGVPTI